MRIGISRISAQEVIGVRWYPAPPQLPCVHVHTELTALFLSFAAREMRRISEQYPLRLG